MDEQLNNLITYYEEEKARLLQLIDENLKEEEYQFAYFHQRALYQLNGKLQTLQNLKDRFYDEKASMQRAIDYFEKRLQSENVEYMREFFARELLRRKAELEELNQQPGPGSTHDAPAILDAVIRNLLDRKIKGFKLILRKSDSLLLEFRYRGGVLKVTLPFIKQHTTSYAISHGKVRILENLGFQLIDSDKKLMLKLTGSAEEILSRLKIILSKVVFEIFYFKEFENESYIEVEVKPGR